VYRCRRVCERPRYRGRVSDLLGGDHDLRLLLERLDPRARDPLCRVLIHDQADRYAIASGPLRHSDERGDEWADIVDVG
jgi:hypothetical protein